MTKNTPTSTTEPQVEESTGTISFSVRLTKKERDLLARAAEKRGWSLTSLLKNAGLEKAVHILNTSVPSKIDFRGTAEEIARQVFTPRSVRTIDSQGEPVHAEVHEHLEEVYIHRDATNPVEVSPWHRTPSFLADIRDAALYGGTEFLDLIIRASAGIVSRDQGDLPDPIDPRSI